MSSSPAGSAKPEIVAIDALLDSVLKGETRIPRFQRPYIWTLSDMTKLFESISMGFPIGSLLIWQTDQENISSLDRIGPLDVPSGQGRQHSYVVDGHQRLATLLGVLSLPEKSPRETQDQWRWWIAYDLQEEGFVHLNDRYKLIEPRFLPLRNLLRTVDFVRHTRTIFQTYGEDEAVNLIDKADKIQKAFRDYKIPLIVMKSGSLDDAVDIFSRVNRRGRDMSADQMVSALTFRGKGEGDFDLAESIDIILGDLQQFGFGNLQRPTILQTILMIAGLDPSRTAYEKFIDRDSYLVLRDAVEKARVALLSASKFLNQHIELRTNRLLPYASVMMMLAVYFNHLGDDKSPDNFLLKRWFWATAFNGWFAGANSTDIRMASDQMKVIANQGDRALYSFDDFFIKDKLRPFPLTFDRRSARIRASLLVQIISGRPCDLDGKQIDGSAVFANESSRDIPYVFTNLKKPALSSPANRVILPAGSPRTVRSHFLELRDTLFSRAEPILRSHFITDEAMEALKAGNAERFIEIREQTLFAAENEFLQQFGLSFDPDSERGIEEMDADE